MRRISFSIFSIIQLLLSGIILIIWYVMFDTKIPDYLEYYIANFIIIFSIIFEFLIKVQGLFKGKYSFSQTIVGLMAYNLGCLIFMMVCCDSEHIKFSTTEKLILISRILAMTLPDILLILYIRFHEKKHHKGSKIIDINKITNAILNLYRR